MYNKSEFRFRCLLVSICTVAYVASGASVQGGESYSIHI